MANWAAMSIRRLLGGRRNYCNMAAAATRFHPNNGGGISISKGESPISAGKPPLPLLIVPPEMVADYMSGDATKSDSYNFMRIEKQEDDDRTHKKKIIMVEKNSSNKLPWEKLLLPDDAICRGSSHGWLAFVHPSTSEVGLFNPFFPRTNQVSFPYIPLPRSDTIKKVLSGERQIYKADNLSYSPRLLREGDSSSLIKLALSSAPDLVGGGDCSVVAISESFKRLVFCKLGDSSWTNLKGSLDQYSDVIYFSTDRRFYAVKDYPWIDMYGRCPHHIESWDFSTCPPKCTVIQPSVDSIPPTIKQFPFNPQGWRAEKTHLNEDGKISCDGTTKRYLVEASGELLLVLRFKATKVGKDGYVVDWSKYNQSEKSCKERDWNYSQIDDDELKSDITVGFAVYKMNWSDNKWEPVESLGDKALFVGVNHSFSISTHDLPQVMRNSIYFTDDRNIEYDHWGYDSGVYNMEDAFISGILPSSLEEINQPPLWFLPNSN